ncbi:PREDICTED: insulin-like growth factor-binding protein 7 [Pygoscelis adeliae]|uniref:insulin-like growth factor-binding protein 7 n=1 Tax=Pygoscelis adeliae TaxID=9238 RepID=UPI0004F4EA84|nr:PREDICTED: insulin-like growth factor-binding protein 7 [Pygoscelis adeliae]
METEFDEVNANTSHVAGWWEDTDPPASNSSPGLGFCISWSGGLAAVACYLLSPTTKESVAFAGGSCRHFFAASRESVAEQSCAGPSIVTPPKDIWNVTGAQIYLSCEVMGIPTPVLIWNKIIRGQYGVQRMELLPGDRENLAIQTRGGPEKHEVTGWVLISPLSKEDAGEYECHASNAKGEATASAKIHVVETLHEIALTKDDGAEL